MPIGCEVDITFYDKLIIRTALPLVVIGILALAGWLTKSRGRGRLSNSLFSICFFLTFLLYPGCTSTAFSAFNCSPLDDGSRYLRRDPSLSCNTSRHKAMEAFASVMIGPTAIRTRVFKHTTSFTIFDLLIAQSYGRSACRSCTHLGSGLAGVSSRRRGHESNSSHQPRWLLAVR